MARAYEITGNETDKKIVDTFFEALYNNHSYATAGSNGGDAGGRLVISETFWIRRQRRAALSTTF